MITNNEFYRWKTMYLANRYRFVARRGHLMSADYRQGMLDALKHLENNMRIEGS